MTARGATTVAATGPTAARRGRRRAVAAAVAVVVAGALAACGGAGSSSGRGSGGDGERSVVLVTYDAFALPKDAAAEFRRRTGARIRVQAAGDAGAMLSRALLSAGAPEGDVLFGVDTTLATRVTDADLLEPYVAPAAAALPAAVRLPGRLGRLLTPVDRGDVCINADATWFAARDLPVPTSFADLAEPRYRDLLVVPSPVTSSPGLAFLAGTVAATPDWEAYWVGLRENGVRVRPSWDDAYFTDFTVSGGDRPLVVSYATSPPAEVLLGEDGRTEPRSSVVTGTCVAQVEYAGVLRGAAHPALAEQLVDFLLSPGWQAALPASNFVLPVVPGTPVPDEFTRWVPTTDPVVLDPVRVGREREAWIERWRSIME